MKRILMVPLLAVGVVLTGCGGEAPTEPPSAAAEMATLTGQVSYRERILLKPGTMMTVTLEDISKMDVAAEPVSSLSFEVQGPPPFPFALQYDPTRIQERHRYGLRVRIEEGSALKFINDSHIDPFANEGEMAIQVRAAGQ
ncbi:YbaY family lipoprotein [Ferrimonas balearica]|uniref:YbaY family lipoprotein n=1 Tax=Ferrimonas balearica TaxID=44012 RepID=UPI001C990F2B|nr:YbaY family lipoprotein [Ferrimonas balearica]MBY5994129.1 YbaY family lipoprotein [Ferrimonas balearica]